ncbi:OmpA family protein [Foetidibacter luteolus]|uniref:OmpA family protein n=1 Tax=Foetidibacter luteolus TaxID=2608880 RepID=UPI00129BFD91|nr:OmpA family protein [Foetidibacter luteolus]
MASKKYALVAGLLSLISTVSFAQRNDANADYALDSSKVSVKDMPQYSEFRNNQYPYPAKPKSQWELGIAAGYAVIAGDIKSKAGFGGGISLRKALGHVFSLRFGYFGHFTYGEPSAYQDNFSREFRAKTHSGAIDLIASLNTISHYRGNPKTNIYLLVGSDLIMTQVQQKNAQGEWHNFYGQGLPNTQSGIIGTVLGEEVNGRKGWTLLHGLSFGGGIAFKVSDRWNIGVEQRFTTPSSGYDYLDGQKGAGGNRDIYSLTTARMNFNLGSTSKKVAPLWWINPNNFIYNELNVPKHMKIPTPVLPDADGDGVTDQFDQEPNTPAGSPVDSHGVAKDTDGDGVPDYKDKELLTAQSCFPVDADGVGKCPEPPCCAELREAMKTLTAKPTCEISLPSVTFKAGSVTLSKDAQAILTSAAQQINSNPTCNVKVIGYGATNKREQQLSWDRVNAVIKYLVEKQGVAESRFIFTYGQMGDANTVDLQGTSETGPSTVPAPHPQYKKTK